MVHQNECIMDEEDFEDILENIDKSILNCDKRVQHFKYQNTIFFIEDKAEMKKLMDQGKVVVVSNY